MTHFKYSEAQLLDKPLPELRQIHRQVGASWEVGDDQRKKANWIKSILNHQANIQERIPAKEESKIFTEIDTNAQPGDYFRIPFKPIVQVVERSISSRKDKVVYVIETVSGDREEWEVKLTTTPQPEPAPQPQPSTPVDPLDKPFDQLTKKEWDWLKRMPNPDNLLISTDKPEEELELLIEPTSREISVEQKLNGIWLVWERAVLRGSFYQSSVTHRYIVGDTPQLTKTEAVRAILGHCPADLFGQETPIQTLSPILTHCTTCGGHGCGNCNYTGLQRDSVENAHDYRFQQYDTLEARGSGRKQMYNVFYQGWQIGTISQVRNHKEPWENTQNTYYYITGNGEKYSSSLKAAEALHKWVTNVAA